MPDRATLEGGAVRRGVGLSQAFPAQKIRNLPAWFSITDLITITGPNNSWKQFFRYGNALPISKYLPSKNIPVGNHFCTDGTLVGKRGDHMSVLRILVCCLASSKIALWNTVEPQHLGWRWPKSDLKVTFRPCAKWPLKGPKMTQKWLSGPRNDPKSHF